MTLILAVGDTLQKTHNPTTGAWTITRAPESTNAEVQALVNSIPGGPRVYIGEENAPARRKPTADDGPCPSWVYDI